MPMTPQGFEASLETLIEAVHRHLDHEDRELLPLVEFLDPSDQQELSHTIERAVAHATTHPDPPHNPVGRAMVNLGEKIDRSFNDISTPWHPGLEQLADKDAHRAGES
jgi:hypothetical protein